jgi:YVTN family beta-propeller protein
MKRFLLIVSIITSLFFLSLKARAQGNQNISSGAATTAVNFTGTGCVYNWVNDTPGIGLAASGTGNIASFTAVNNGSGPVMATITATPAPTGYAYISNTYSNSVSVISVATNQIVATIPVGSEPVGVAVSADGSRVYVANSSSNNISVINALTNLVIATINVGSYIYSIAVSPDGSQVYVGNFSGGTVSIIDTATNSVIATIPAGSNPFCVCVSPDGRR